MLASYEYTINTNLTNLMDVTGKQLVWYEYNFTASKTVENKRRLSAFLGSIVIGNCVDIVFFLAWLKCPCTVANDLGEYLLTIFDVIPGLDQNIKIILPLSVWKARG